MTPQPRACEGSLEPEAAVVARLVWLFSLLSASDLPGSQKLAVKRAAPKKGMQEST